MLIGLKKFVLYNLYLLLFFFLVGFGIIQIPAIQKPIVKYYTDQLSKVSGFDISFSTIHFIWYDRFQIEGLLIKDSDQNTMVQSELLSVNYKITSLLEENQINIDAAVLRKAKVNLIKITDTDNSKNLNINILIKRLSKPRTGQKAPGTKVNIGEIILDQSEFSYSDPDKDSLLNQFDHRHFSLAVHDGQFQNFKVIGDTIQFKVNSLSVVDQQSQFEIKQLQTFFRISQSSMEFFNLKLDAGNSHIEDTVIFEYKSQLDLNDFNNLVKIKAKLRNTKIDPHDLALFAPAIAKIKSDMYIEGDLSGRVNNFNVQNMILGVGNTKLSGSLGMDGLPTINETFINLRLQSSVVDIHDLEFAFPSNTFKRIQPLNKFLLSGNFTGFVNDFVVDGFFDGDFGQIKSDLNLKINESDIGLSEYSGKIELTEFELGAYINDTVNFKTVSLKGKIDGRGFTEESADFQLNGSISNFGIRKYNYKNITTSAQFSSQFFNGTLTIEDPNIKLSAEGSIDFRENHNLVKIKAKLDTIFFDRIGFGRENLFLRSDLSIDTKGLKMDSLFGKAQLSNTIIRYRTDSLEIDSIKVISSNDVNGRNLYLRSSIVDIDLSGDYYYSTLFSDLGNLYREFYLAIKNDKSNLDKYYESKKIRNQEYTSIFFINFYDINPLIRMIGIDMSLSKNMKVQGRFSNGVTSNLNVFTTIDTLIYQGKIFTQNEIDFNGSKIRNSTNILAMLSIFSNEQAISKNFNSKDLIFDAIWNSDHIEIGLDFDQIGFENSVRLKSSIDFLNDSTKIKILPSQIKVLNGIWHVGDMNYAIQTGREWKIHNLELTNDEQLIQLNGAISSDPTKSLRLSISNLEIDVLNSISEEAFTGVLNGSVEARDLYDNTYIQNDIIIKNLAINKFLIGDVTGINTWNKEKKRIDINFVVDRLNTSIVSLVGYYLPGKVNPLVLKAQFKKANLKIAEPLLKDLFSEMEGTLTGNYNITGSFIEPKINGEGLINNGQILINYLMTKYSFTGILALESNALNFRSFRLTDVFNNTATLEGFIAHQNFNQFRINLDCSFSNFQLLNTTTKDNSLFYGQGYASGNANIYGPSSSLKISATAKTEKNTKLYIPMSTSGDVKRKNFINFVHFTDTAFVSQNSTSLETKKNVRTSGISIDLNLDITPNAYTEIIFDIKSGDIIRGRGNGNIKLQIDTKGEFTMFGAVEFTEGAYNFTLYDIINKEFDIESGSKISWYGNPYKGQMDITANYNQIASLAPILSDQTVVSNTQIRRKYPTKVQLSLDGPMLSPQISFDIEVTDLPDNIIVEGRPPIRLAFEFQVFKSNLDEQELKRQVFSLIVLRKFSPPNAFNTSGTLYNSLSELLSNQLSYWLTQVDQNLEIDLDLGTLDQEAFNTFQLRLSYSFLNGRLRVTKDGIISNQYQPSNNISSIAGDWTVDYLLTQDGKFKVKMYSRSNYNQLTGTLVNRNAVTTGVSLMHTQSFNELKDLLKFARDKGKKNEQEDLMLQGEASKEEEVEGN